MWKRVCWLAAVSTLGLLAIVPKSVSAAPPAEKRRQVTQIDGLISKAGNLFRNKKFAESADAIRNAQSQLEELAETGGKEMLPLLEDSFKRLQKAHSLLELEGHTLPPLKKPADILAAKPESTGRVPGGAVSFINHIAPIMISKCGRCHVNDAKGMFSMSNYASLMKGPKEGKVVFPNDADGSRLIEVIESGDMPRVGLKVAPEELATLKKWITEGAKFDGKSDQDPLSSLVPNAKPAELPQTQITKSTGQETVSFANEIATVLAKQCLSCHGTMRPRENFSLATFQGLLKGGDGGPPIIPGDPAESLLIKKLKGTGGGQRMPQGRPPLDDDTIAKIETWIKEGATFDARDPGMALVRLVALAKAIRATHEELCTDRNLLADENWRLAMPTVNPAKQESKNVLVFGNVGPNTLAYVSESAETLAPKIAALFKSDEESPLLKGRLTLFAFEQRYDYTEFGQMVEKRELPKEWRSHWQFDVLDAYGAFIMPRGKDESIDALLTHALAATHVASLGSNVPHWFAEGCGRVAAAKMDGSDKRVIATNEALPEALGASTKADDFLTGKLSNELRDVASYSFVSSLMSDTKNFDRLLQALRKSGDFDQAFAQVYHATPNQLAETWIKRPGSIKTKGARNTKKT